MYGRVSDITADCGRVEAHFVQDAFVPWLKVYFLMRGIGRTKEETFQRLRIRALQYEYIRASSC